MRPRVVPGSRAKAGLAALVCLGTTVACSTAVDPGDRPPAAIEAPVVSGPPEPTARAFEVVVDGEAARPAAAALTEARRAAPGEHAEPAGWSADGSEFAYCQALAGCRECRRVALDGAARVESAGEACPPGAAAIAPAELDARLAAIGPSFGAPPWPRGAELVLAVSTREHERTNAGGARPMLKVGAQVRGGERPAWLVFVDPCEGCGLDQVCVGQAHLDALVPSPDGEHVAVLIHGAGNDGREDLRLELLSSERLAAAARAPASRAR